MATTLLCGFEMGHPSEAQFTNGSVTVVTAPARNGGRALRCVPGTAAGSGAYVRFQSRVAGGTTPNLFLSLSFYMNIVALPASNIMLAYPNASANNTQPWVLQLTPTGALTINDDTTGPTTQTIALNTWTLVEVSADIANNAVAVSINGTLAKTFTRTGMAACNQLMVGLQNIVVSEVVFDDVVAYDTAIPSNRPTDYRLTLLKPTADAAVGNWRRNDGTTTTNLWSAVDNVPPNGTAATTTLGTAYIQNSTAGSNVAADSVDLTCQAYSNAFGGAHTQVHAIMPILNHAQQVTTGSPKSGAITALPVTGGTALADTTFDYGLFNGGAASAIAAAQGAFPAGWGTSSGTVGTVEISAGTSTPVVRVKRTGTYTRAISVDTAGVYALTAPPPPLVDPPSLRVATTSTTSIDLAWTKPAGAATYNVQRESAGVWSNIATGLTTLSYSATGLTTGASYTHRVVAFNAAGTTSTISNSVTAKAENPPIPDHPHRAIEITAKTMAGKTNATANEAWEGSTPEYGAWYVWRPGTDQNGITVKFGVKGATADTYLGLWTGPSDKASVTATGGSAGNMVFVANYDDTGNGIVLNGVTLDSTSAYVAQVIDSTKTYYLNVGFFSALTNENFDMLVDTLGTGTEQKAALVDAPTVTAKTASSTAIDVSWTKPVGAETFTVQYNLDNGTTWTTAATNVTATSYQITGLTASTTYYIRVQAHNPDKTTTTTSATVTSSTNVVAPTARTLSATVVNSGRIDLSWNADTTANPAPTYNVEFSTSGTAGPWNVAASGLTTNSYSHLSLNGSTTYYHRVIGSNSAGTATSNVTTATTPAGSSTTLLKDDFANLNNWTHDVSPAVATATGGLLKLTPNSNYHGIKAANLTNTFGKGNFAEWAQYSDTGTQQFFGYTFNDAAPTEIFFSLFDNVLYSIHENGAGTSTNTSVTFNATEMKYWRVGESSGFFYWETSPDAVTWTSRRTLAHSLPNTTDGRVCFYSWIPSGSTSARTADFASLNLAPGESLVTKVETLSDAFSSIDTGKWAAVGTSGSTTIDNDRLKIVAGNNNGLSSVAEFTLRDSSMYIQTVSSPTGVDEEQNFAFRYTDGITTGFSLANGSLMMYKNAAGTITQSTIAFDAATMRWWRLRDAAGTLYMDTSPDGTTWTQRYTTANPEGAAEGGKVRITALSALATPGSAVFDNFNMVPPAPAPQTGHGQLVGIPL